MCSALWRAFVARGPPRRRPRSPPRRRCRACPACCAGGWRRALQLRSRGCGRRAGRSRRCKSCLPPRRRAGRPVSRWFVPATPPPDLRHGGVAKEGCVLPRLRSKFPRAVGVHPTPSSRLVAARPALRGMEEEEISSRAAAWGGVGWGTAAAAAAASATDTLPGDHSFLSRKRGAPSSPPAAAGLDCETACVCRRLTHCQIAKVSSQQGGAAARLQQRLHTHSLRLLATSDRARPRGRSMLLLLLRQRRRPGSTGMW